MKRAPTACSLIAIGVIVLLSVLSLAGCSTESADSALTQNTYLELVDWHITGFWVINEPVCWVRVKNLNSVPIKDIKIQYNSFDFDGTPAGEGTYTLTPSEDPVAPGEVKNFIEQYVGPVNLHSEKLMVKLVSVSHG
jgi:hypothetical protein